MKHIFLYPAWSLYPQIFPLEIQEDTQILSTAAELFSIPEHLVTIYNEKLQVLDGSFTGELEPDARIGITIEGSPFYTSMFEIGQTSCTSLSIPEPPKPQVSPSPAFRKDVMMSESEHKLVRQLVRFDTSDNLERFGQIDLHDLLPYRRPGDPQVTVTIRLLAHLSRNNAEDLERIIRDVARIRQEAAKAEKFDRYRIEIDLHLLLNNVETNEAEWLPWVSRVMDNALRHNKESRTHAVVGPFNKIFAYSYNQLTVSNKHFESRKQCVESVVKLNYLSQHHPIIGDILNRSYLTSFNTLPGPLNDTENSITRRAVTFFLDPELAIPLIARWHAAEMTMENFKDNEAKILQKGEEYAREILACVGLLPEETGEFDIPISFDAGSFYEDIIREIPLKLGNISLSEDSMSKKESLETLENLLSFSSDWQEKDPGFFLGREKNVNTAARMVVMAQVNAFRSALHHVCERLASEHRYQVLYAAMRAVHRLLDLIPAGEDQLSQVSGEDAGDQTTVRGYLKKQAGQEKSASFNYQEIKSLIKQARPTFFKRILFRKALKKARQSLIAELSKGIGTSLKHHAYAIVEKHLTLGTGFTAAWHLARRYKAKAEAERQHIDLMVKECQRSHVHMVASLDQVQKERVIEWRNALREKIRINKDINQDIDAKIRDFLNNLKTKGTSQLESGLFEFIDKDILPALKTIIDKLVDRCRIDLKSELREKIDHFLNFTGFRIGYLKRNNPALIRETHQALHLFTPLLSTDKKEEMGRFLETQQANFKHLSPVVEVPGILETVMVMEYYFCPISCFAPEPFWKPKEEPVDESIAAAGEEYL